MFKFFTKDNNYKVGDNKGLDRGCTCFKSIRGFSFSSKN